MRIANLASLVTVFLLGTVLVAQDDDKLLSGPLPGKFIPAPFECMNINGPATGRPRCLVCKFALSPAVLVFAKDPADTLSPFNWTSSSGGDDALNEFLKQLDEAMADFHEERGFSVGVIFLSSAARDSTNNVAETKSAEIIREAMNREKLTKRLSERAKNLKHVVIGYYLSEGPKGFDINPKAEQTVIYYERMKVLENWTYAPEQLDAKHIEAMVKRIRDTLPTKKKPAEVKG